MHLLPRAILPLILVCSASAATITPIENPDAVLHNPDMGWLLYENYPLDPAPGGTSTLASCPDENFDGVDAVAVMFAWSDVEKTEGNYDFSKVDFAYDYWKARGKTMQLRMSTESLLWWSKRSPPTGLGIPKYVLDRLPKDKQQVRNAEGFDYVVVDARHHYYLERLDKFLTAVRAHFDSKRPVNLIDLRGFGLWGEWHSGYRYAMLKDRREALCTIIDHWSRAFPDHYLAISYSHDPDGPASYFEGPTDHFDSAFTRRYDEYVKFSAFDRAMSKANATLRRDRVGGAVWSNQRKLCDEAFNTVAKGPMVCEFVTWYAEAKKGDKNWMPFLINDALSLHANYINLLGYCAADALHFLQEQRNLIDYGLRNMGYRLIPTSVTLPDQIRAGNALKIDMAWINRGVGRAMRDYRLRLSVGDTILDAGPLPTSKWIRGQTYSTSSEASLKPIPPGRYPMRFELIDPATDRAIALPLKDNTLGTIEVK